MEKTKTARPKLSPDVTLGKVDADGRMVVKSRDCKYLQLGEQEGFLLQQFNGRRSYRRIRDKFKEQFGESIRTREIQSFAEMAEEQGLLDSAVAEDAPQLPLWKRTIEAARKQSLFYFRVKVIDPNAALNWLEPRTRWLFSVELAVIAAVMGMFAIALTWLNRAALAEQLVNSWSWRTFLLAWLTAVVVTVCHEFAHGLACKRYGGDVREMGVLWMFFTPCLYANVSDAWLFPNRWHRLLVSLAGTYIDFLIFIPAVFVWRLTEVHTSTNYIAWIIVTACGVRVAFNINPLLRLDGYYALSDLLAVPNLRRRGRDRMWAYARWVLWGGEFPKPEESERAVLIYGVVSWVFTIGFINLLFFKIAGWLHSAVGIFGVIAAAGVFMKLTKRYFRGSLGEDFKNMFIVRNKRFWMWGGAILVLLITPIYDRAGGPFQVRPMVRWEVRAPVAGFLREINTEEGETVAPGYTMFHLEVPELTSQISRKEAEIRETQATLTRLEAGTRPEELQQQREKVARSIAWNKLGLSDLKRAQQAFEASMKQLSLRIEQAQRDVAYHTSLHEQAKQLYERGGLAGRQLMAVNKQLQESQTAMYQLEAQVRERQAQGVISYETELARRAKDLADTQATLRLMEAGTRHEEIEAQRALLARLEEEIRHLRSINEKQQVVAKVGGTVTTPRLREKIGQWVERGALLCIVEDLENLEAELAVSEQDARVLVPGHPVTLKPRAMPFTSLVAHVDRVAPAAANLAVPTPGQTQPVQDKQTTVTVYCTVKNSEGELRTGMTGFGRISHGLRPIGWIAIGSFMRVLRTEFWF